MVVPLSVHVEADFPREPCPIPGSFWSEQLVLALTASISVAVLLPDWRGGILKMPFPLTGVTWNPPGPGREALGRRLEDVVPGGSGKLQLGGRSSKYQVGREGFKNQEGGRF